VDKRWFLGLGVLMLVARAYGVPAPREIGLKASDGTQLKATYFSSGQPGPGVLLLHQNNPHSEIMGRRSRTTRGSRN
jgi:hypothetical protein